jgi:hypothetical protein
VTTLSQGCCVSGDAMLIDLRTKDSPARLVIDPPSSLNGRKATDVVSTLPDKSKDCTTRRFIFQKHAGKCSTTVIKHRPSSFGESQTRSNVRRSERSMEALRKLCHLAELFLCGSQIIVANIFVAASPVKTRHSKNRLTQCVGG